MKKVTFLFLIVILALCSLTSYAFVDNEIQINKDILICLYDDAGNYYQLTGHNPAGTYEGFCVTYDSECTFDVEGEFTKTGPMIYFQHYCTITSGPCQCNWLEQGWFDYSQGYGESEWQNTCGNMGYGSFEKTNCIEGASDEIESAEINLRAMP